MGYEVVQICDPPPLLDNQLINGRFAIDGDNLDTLSRVLNIINFH